VKCCSHAGNKEDEINELINMILTTTKVDSWDNSVISLRHSCVYTFSFQVTNI
jgi:plasmid replication initiation protein